MTANPHRLVLEPAAQAFVEATDLPPHLNDLGPETGREAVDEVQNESVSIPVDDEWVTISASAGPVRVRVVRPGGASGPLPAVLYIHGAGWVFGNAHTHDRLVREVATQSGAAIVFPEYHRSPEAKYPVALEQTYAVARWIADHGSERNLDPARVAVAGDSVGGNLAIGTTILSLQRRDFDFRALVAFYPVTDADFGTESYTTFAEGYFLRREAMRWFWDQYTADPGQRAEITASPLRADPKLLGGFPPSLIITAEADVLRDEGEAFAARLRAAGVATTAVRYHGVIHDFVMLNALKDTDGAKAATAQAAAFLAKVLDIQSF